MLPMQAVTALKVVAKPKPSREISRVITAMMNI